MNHNLLPSDRAAIVGVINPTSQAAGALSTGWIDMAAFLSIMAIVQAGVLGASATLDAKIEQATSAAGAGAKDVVGKAIVQFTKAGSDDNKQALINLRAEELDINGGFTFARLTVTNAVAASLTSAIVIGMDRRYGAASVGDIASVDEIVA
jgi:hypothetical protein